MTRSEFPIPWKNEGKIIGTIQLMLVAVFVMLATQCG